MLYSVNKNEEVQEEAFQVTLKKTALRRWGGEPGYIGVFQQREGNGKITVNKRKRDILALFYVREYAGVWTHRDHSFDMDLSSPGPVSCVFTSRVSSGLSIHREWLPSDAARWQVFFVYFLRSLRAHRLSSPQGGGCTHWWPWHPLLSGNILFLTVLLPILQMRKLRKQKLSLA